MRITKRTRVLIASGLGLVAIVAMVFAGFAFTNQTHAAAGGNNPHVLSPNFLTTHHAQPGYGDLPARATSKVNTKVSKTHSAANCIPGINGVSN